jgi:serine/threonine protein kinase
MQIVLGSDPFDITLLLKMSLQGVVLLLLDRLLFCWQGTLRDGSEVAVKELPSNIQPGNQEFLNEVQLISSLDHKNLVKLRGCAISGNNRLLVYEYVENECLAQALFG